MFRDESIDRSDEPDKSPDPTCLTYTITILSKNAELKSNDSDHLEGGGGGITRHKRNHPWQVRN
ncbi:hypothetical protein MJO28_009288 [Puccinia striiformis f. sp. tritici]|uniref:Uncharacterized protein n=1 Tax=Puccinia striiformis f. sp. tritici TaxID=168172 RepID=A0ACC0E8B2_9BASI|nr:hypothetical protein MJO28_009288 [Puccinia striiformis f. sp. tritici]